MVVYATALLPLSNVSTRNNPQNFDTMESSWDEVERMAQAASAQDAQMADEYSPDAIARWQRLFGYTSIEAKQLIKQQREDGAYPPFRVAGITICTC